MLDKHAGKTRDGPSVHGHMQIWCIELFFFVSLREHAVLFPCWHPVVYTSNGRCLNVFAFPCLQLDFEKHLPRLVGVSRLTD